MGINHRKLGTLKIRVIIPDRAQHAYRKYGLSNLLNVYMYNLTVLASYHRASNLIYMTTNGAIIRHLMGAFQMPNFRTQQVRNSMT